MQFFDCLLHFWPPYELKMELWLKIFIQIIIYVVDVHQCPKNGYMKIELSKYELHAANM